MNASPKKQTELRKKIAETKPATVVSLRIKCEKRKEMPIVISDTKRNASVL